MAVGIGKPIFPDFFGIIKIGNYKKNKILLNKYKIT